LKTLSDWVLSPETTSQKPFSRTPILSGTAASNKSTLVTTATCGYSGKETRTIPEIARDDWEKRASARDS
jgi:hypothetical protein